MSSFSAVYQVSIPGGYPSRSILLFQASRRGQFLYIALRVMLTLTVGRWLVVNHKHDDYASTALTFANVTNTTKLYRGRIERERLEEIYISSSGIIFMRDGVQHPTSFVEASRKKAKLKELSNNISDGSEA